MFWNVCHLYMYCNSLNYTCMLNSALWTTVLVWNYFIATSNVVLLVHCHWHQWKEKAHTLPTSIKIVEALAKIWGGSGKTFHHREVKCWKVIFECLLTEVPLHLHYASKNMTLTIMQWLVRECLFTCMGMSSYACVETRCVPDSTCTFMNYFPSVW